MLSDAIREGEQCRKETGLQFNFLREAWGQPAFLLPLHVQL